MRAKTLAIAASIACTNTVRAADCPTVPNGSFEDISVSGCQFNLDNATYTSVVANSAAFGTANEICLMNGADGCGWGLPPERGDTKVGLASNPALGWSDAISLEITPVVAGGTYELTCWAHAVIIGGAPDIGIVEFGLSNDPMSFGTAIRIASPSETEWTDIGGTFLAPISANYLTVRVSDAVDSWTHIDEVSLDCCPSVINGDFRFNSGDCEFNLSNELFTAMVFGATGFGSGNQICLMSDAAGCGWGLPPLTGDTKIGLAGIPADGTADAFSLPMAVPLDAGATYALNCWAHAVIEDFSPDNGIVEIGVSNDPTSFGTLVMSGSPSDAAWTDVGGTFVAPFAAEHLTFRVDAALDSWTHLDSVWIECVCVADFGGDGVVDTADLLSLLAAWGGPDGDLNGDGTTDVADLLALVGAWGPCP